ncbi:unnamed protein product [Sphagnum tenellum]
MGVLGGDPSYYTDMRSDKGSAGGCILALTSSQSSNSSSDMLTSVGWEEWRNGGLREFNKYKLRTMIFDFMSSGGGGQVKRSVGWDEDTIALHDKERGTRMKIEEPKTPFHYSFDGEVEEGGGYIAATISESNFHVVREKLKEHEEEAARGGSVDWEGHERDASDAKRRAFEEKRKKHYNEFQRVKMVVRRDSDDVGDDEV